MCQTSFFLVAILSHLRPSAGVIKSNLHVSSHTRLIDFPADVDVFKKRNQPPFDSLRPKRSARCNEMTNHQGPLNLDEIVYDIVLMVANALVVCVRVRETIQRFYQGPKKVGV